VFLWLSVAGAVGLVLLYKLFSDRFLFGEVLAVWPAYLWGIPLVALTLPTINVRRPRRFLIALGSVVLAVMFTSEWRSVLRRPDRSHAAEFAALREQPSEDAALRILIWNVADYMSNKSEVLKTMAEYDPDLCLLQETGDGDGSFLPEDLVGPWEGFHWIDAGDEGVLSRHPIATLPTAAAEDHLGVQTVTLALPNGRDIAVANVHLSMPAIVWNLFTRGGPDFEQIRQWRSERFSQYASLADTVDRLRAGGEHDAILAAGDFNVPGDLHSLRPIRERLSDVWPNCGVGWSATMTDANPMARIDHCWVSEEFTPIVARVHETGVSDHRLLVVDLTLRNVSPVPNP
jgi:endonuclease/exonuclease/phosphatase (EEP) superfamily protein YafD